MLHERQEGETPLLWKNAALGALSAGCQGGNGSQSVAHPTNSMTRACSGLWQSHGGAVSWKMCRK